MDLWESIIAERKKSNVIHFMPHSLSKEKKCKCSKKITNKKGNTHEYNK